MNGLEPLDPRERANLCAIDEALRSATRSHKMTPAEAWIALMNHAASTLAHQCGAETDEEFDGWLANFVAAASLYWQEHKRECMGDGMKAH